MENIINRNNFIEQLREFFPETESLYQKRIKGLGTPTDYEVVAFVLRPYLQEEISKGYVTDFLKRFACFCEKVCTSGDTETINVIWIKIFEWLIFRPSELRFLWPIFGPSTKDHIRDAAHRWSDAARSNGKTEDLPEDNVPA